MNIFSNYLIHIRELNVSNNLMLMIFKVNHINLASIEEIFLYTYEIVIRSVNSFRNY